MIYAVCRECGKQYWNRRKCPRLERLYAIVDAGYKDPSHPVMGGAAGCETCDAERTLNKLATPHRMLSLVRALEKMCDMSGHGAECASWIEYEEGTVRVADGPCTCPKGGAEAALAALYADLEAA